MIDACGDISIDTGVEISQNEILERHVLLLDFAITLEKLVLLLVDVEKLFRTCLVVNPISPDIAHSLPQLIILNVRQKAQHFLTVSFDSEQLVVVDNDLLELPLQVFVSLAKAWVQRIV